MRKFGLFPAALVIALCLLAAAIPNTCAAQDTPEQEASEALEAASQAVKEAVEALEKHRVPAAEGQQVQDNGNVINLQGDVEIQADQTVAGDVVAVGGSAHIRGTVNGNVVALDGSIHLYEGANIKGDIMAIGGEVVREANVEVGGSKLQISAPWAEQILEGISLPAAEAAEEAPEPEAEEPQAAQLEEAVTKGLEEGFVRFGKSVRVKASETVNDDIVVFGAPVRVFGKVNGDVICFGGTVVVKGTVKGDIVAFGGPVRLGGNARVEGDVVTMGGAVHKEAGAVIMGDEVSFGRSLGMLPLGSRVPILAGVVRWFINGIVGLMILLVLVVAAPKQMDAIAVRVAEEPGRALAYGSVGILVALPILGVLVVLVVTWLLIPLYVAGAIALGVVGMAGMYILIGRHVSNQLNLATTSIPRLALIGFVLFCAVGLIRLVPVVGLAAWLFFVAALVFGFGGALMTGFGTDPTGTWLGGRRAELIVSVEPDEQPAETGEEPPTVEPEDAEEQTAEPSNDQTE